MAFETGGSSGIADLIDKIRVFAIGLGWTVDYNSARATGTTDVGLFLHKGSTYLCFYQNTAAGTTSDPGPYLVTFHYPGPFNSAPADKTAQTSRGDVTVSNKMPGPFQAYYLFGSDDYLHVVVEVTPGNFKHLGGGAVAKAGAVTSGVYSHGMRWNYDFNFVNTLTGQSIPFDSNNPSTTLVLGTSVRADREGVSPSNVVFIDNTSSYPNSGGWGGFMGTGGSHAGPVLNGLMNVAPSSLTGRAPLFPAMLAVFRPSGQVSLIGSVKDVRFCRIDNLLPAEAVTIGPDTWRVFPISRKNGPLGQENSGNFGYAYRVVP